MKSIALTHLSVTQTLGTYWLEMGWPDDRGNERRIKSSSDLNLAMIMGSFSASLHVIESGDSQFGNYKAAPIELSTWNIVALPESASPYRWQMTMADAKFSYTVNMDSNLEMVIYAFAGALKFFCFKHGLSTLGEEVVRQRDRAGEAGLLTKEDFPNANA